MSKEVFVLVGANELNWSKRSILFDLPYCSKYKLHLYFKQIGGGNDIDMAKKKRHPDLKDDKQKDWEFLCERWCSENFKVSYSFFNYNPANLIYWFSFANYLF